MKRIFFIFYSVLILISLIACREKTKEEEFNDIQKTFANINNYSSIGNIRVIGNKSSQTFRVKHVFEKPDKYIAEIIEPKENQGNKTIYNGNTAYMYNKKADQYSILKQIETSKDKILFLGYFLRNLSNTEEIEIDKDTIDKKDYIVLGVKIPGDNMHRYYEKIWIDKTSKLPYKLIIYNSKSLKVLEIIYEEVKYNIDIDKEIFNIN